MTLVMAYVILISAVVGAGAVVLEVLVRGRGAVTRWVWVSAMASTIAVALFAMVAPQRDVVRVVDGGELVPSNVLMLRDTGTPLSASERSPSLAEAALNAGDSILPAVWLIATILLLAALAMGQRRFRVERRRAREMTIGGHEVLITDDLGPAVAGVRRPVVFVPRWVLALDAGSQQLLLAHEIEHVRRRDTSLLLFSAVTAAITPWNPVVWWMVRRLRLAVEQDCDARVLATHPGVRRYADLLLTAASRHGLTTRLLAAHFGEHTSDLVRRIEAMTTRKHLPWQRIAAASFVAVALGAVACESPRPDPVAPLPVQAPAVSEQEVAVTEDRSAEFTEQRARCSTKTGPGCQLAVVVQSSDGKVMARYAGEIPVAHIPEDGIAKIEVEQGACGENPCSLIWITLKPDASLLKTPRRAEPLAATREQAVELERYKEVPDLVIPLPTVLRRAATRDTLVKIEKQQSEVASAGILERADERMALGNGVLGWPPQVRITRRDGKLAAQPNVLIVNSDGVEVNRILAEQFRSGAKNPFDELRPDDIGAIEVRKGAMCAPLACPLIHVTLKPGRDGAYRKR